MYLRKRFGYWVEVYKDGVCTASIHHAKKLKYMAVGLAKHNIKLGYQVEIIDCETGLEIDF